MSGALRFDLARGRVSLTASSDRPATQVVLPMESLAALASGLDAQHLKNFGHHLGSAFGARVAARLAHDAPSAEPTEVVDHLGGEFALSGLGTLLLERWGKALVFALVGCPLEFRSSAEPNVDAGVLLSSILEGALLRIFGRELEVAPLQVDGNSRRFLVCNRTAAGELRTWLASGCSFGEVMARMNEGAVS